MVCFTFPRIGGKGAHVALLVIIGLLLLTVQQLLKSYRLPIKGFRHSFLDAVFRDGSLPNTSLPGCASKSPKLVGPLYVNKTLVRYIEMEKENLGLEMGGHFIPRECKSTYKIAIVIPYRDREFHLKILLHQLHPMLQRQLIDYTLFVIEQEQGEDFNRGVLLNIGFTEAMKRRKYDCFIFHDVDLIPEDDRNLYTCPDVPRHMSVAVDKFKYKIPYLSIFGGVSAMRTEHFNMVNGYSNKFFGWGGEDDNMYRRISKVSLTLSRYMPGVARYTMLGHTKESPNPDRLKLLDVEKYDFKKDGLADLRYTVLQTSLHKLFTRILVRINRADFAID